MQSSTIPYLLHHQVELLGRSFKALDADDYATLFYQKLFWQYPHLRALFPVNLTDQKEKLMSVLELVVHSFEEKTPGNFALHSSLLIPLRHLGVTHEEKGVAPEHYPIANDLMLEIFALTLGDIYTDEMKVAWQRALQQVTDAMLDKKINTEAPENLSALQQGVAFIRKYFSKVV